ncbi:hypothetical protein ACFW2Y_34780 [Streptomyces sp. NPDC058877]|uniref:hypothetical protein n=1 Tax=unclassified Streptomyces TaxID=2593676 RepID=UPI003673EBF0
MVRQDKRRREANARWDEEITSFGELLAAHPFDPARPGTPIDAVQDFERALNAYEQAKQARPGERSGDEQDVLRALTEGRQALARLDAHLSGVPLALCFFDPHHGPAVRELPWAPDGGVSRPVAVCAEDGARLSRGSSSGRRGSGPRRPDVGDAGDAGTRTVPRPGAPLVSGKPRWRDRYTASELAFRSLGVLLVVHALVRSLFIDRGEWWEALAAAVLLSAIGGFLVLVCFVVSIGAVQFLGVLWRWVRGGRRVRADFVRRQKGRSGQEHVFEAIDASGGRHQHTRSVGSPTAAPLPYRMVWLVPGEKEPLGAWAPLGYFIGLSLCVPLFTGGAFLAFLFLSETPS